MAIQKKIIIISSEPAPYQLELAASLQEDDRFRFMFLSNVDKSRPKFWKVKKLPKNCIQMNLSPRLRWFDLKILKYLNEQLPTLIIVGSFVWSSTLIAYLWSLIKNVPIIILTETFRTESGLRKKNILSIALSIFYNKSYAVGGHNMTAVKQLLEIGGWKRVLYVPYPVYHSFIKYTTKGKLNKNLTLLFANRLTDIYSPFRAISIFKQVLDRGFDVRMLMNSNGELYEQCLKLVGEYGIGKNVIFIKDIGVWEDLGRIYTSADVYFFPAKFSNGNLSLLEHMFAGCGIIQSRTLLDSEYLVSGAAGFLCDSDSEFVNSIIEYSLNRDMLAQHCSINNHFVNSSYSIDKIKSRYTKFADGIFDGMD
jgi:glycosyltransferase involved in cell wall biosynthesis